MISYLFRLKDMFFNKNLELLFYFLLWHVEEFFTLPQSLISLDPEKLAVFLYHLYIWLLF